VVPGVEGSNPFTHPTQKRGAMDRKQLSEKINELSKEGKMSCAQAMELARETNTSYSALGDLLDEMKIKITSCQLGCFP
jgi:hypothetical protein